MEQRHTLRELKIVLINKHGWAVHISINMMVTVGVSTWAISSLPVSILAVTKIGVAMTVSPRVVICLVYS